MKNDLLAYRHIGISEKRRGEDAPKNRSEKPGRAD